MKTNHPTKTALLNAAITLLADLPASDITVELVLSNCGISHGSLYHHFRDLPDLLDNAQIVKFGRYVDMSIGSLESALRVSKSKADLITALRTVTSATQGSSSTEARAFRVWVLAQAAIRPEFKLLLAQEQERLTEALIELIRNAQDKGWFRSDIEARTIAVFIQAYTVGKIVNDVSLTDVSAADWNFLVNTVIEQVLVSPNE